MVAIGNCILKIDMLRVGRRKKISAQEPLICPIDKLIDGVVLVGKHDGEITELSMCQWMTSRLASASMDGVVSIFFVDVLFSFFIKKTKKQWLVS